MERTIRNLARHVSDPPGSVGLSPRTPRPGRAQLTSTSFTTRAVCKPPRASIPSSTCIGPIPRPAPPGKFRVWSVELSPRSAPPLRLPRRPRRSGHHHPPHADNSLALSQPTTTAGWNSFCLFLACCLCPCGGRCTTALWRCGCRSSSPARPRSCSFSRQRRSRSGSGRTWIPQGGSQVDTLTDGRGRQR